MVTGQVGRVSCPRSLGSTAFSVNGVFHGGLIIMRTRNKCRAPGRFLREMHWAQKSLLTGSRSYGFYDLSFHDFSFHDFSMIRRFGALVPPRKSEIRVVPPAFRGFYARLLGRSSRVTIGLRPATTLPGEDHRQTLLRLISWRLSIPIRIWESKCVML